MSEPAPRRGYEKHLRIGREPAHPQAGWSNVRLAGLHVSHGAAVNRHPVVGPDGTVRGWLLGWLAGPAGLLPDGTPLPAPAPDEAYAAWSRDLCGRFVCVLEDAAGPTLHTDASGLMGIVWCAESGTAASVPALVDGAEPDHALRETIGVPDRHGWYPFGLTPCRNVERLMPNHALDLTTFAARRIFPSAADPVRPLDVATAEDRVLATLTRVVSGLCAGSDPVVIDLTGGRDSRAILAAAVRAGVRPGTATVRLPGTGAALDGLVARRLARLAGMTHEIRPFRRPRRADAEAWFERTGYCIADNVCGLATTWKAWDPAEIHLAGLCGEVARSFYWGAADAGGRAPDAEELVRRIQAPSAPAILSAAERWLASLPPLPASTVWDLAYVEQRLGCWAGPTMYGAPLPRPTLSPFNAGTAVRAMLGVPEAVRLDKSFPERLIRRAAPGLLEIPFDRLPREAVAARVRFALSRRLRPRIEAAARLALPTGRGRDA